jgi:hypothetical protein
MIGGLTLALPAQSTPRWQVGHLSPDMAGMQSFRSMNGYRLFQHQPCLQILMHTLARSTLLRLAKDHITHDNK